MAVTHEDLRLELDEPEDSWTEDDQLRATAILSRCRTRIVNRIGRSALDLAEAADDEDALGLVDEITIAYAARRFVNPEQALQRRSGSDNSASFSDGSEAASGLTTAEKRDLDHAFRSYQTAIRRRAFTVPWSNQP